jgi:hypothetical protein
VGSTGRTRAEEEALSTSTSTGLPSLA